MLNILYSNINGYLSKKELVYNFIDNNDINLAMFVESRTKDSNTVVYKNWNIIQQNGALIHNHARGGSLVKVHPNLKMGKANAPRINNPLNECIHFTVPYIDDKLHIFLVYIHPHSRIEENIFTMATLHKYAIIIGDLNTTTKPKKKQLNNFLRNTSFVKYDTPPTFLMEHNDDSTPDVILHTSNLASNILKIENITDLTSDHLGFKISIDRQTPVDNTKIERYNFNKTNIKKVNNVMLRYVENVNNTEIDQNGISDFNAELTKVILKNTPKQEVQYYTQELPPFIMSLIKQKRKIYRDYRNSGNVELKREINKHNKSIQQLIQQYREHKWITTCEDINYKKGKNYWNDIKKLSKYRNKNQSTVPLKQNGRTYDTPEEKAQIFAEYFEDSYKESRDDNFDNNHYENIETWFNTHYEENNQTTHNPNEYTIDKAEYYNTLKHGKNSAPGHDYIKRALLKQLDDKIHKYIIKIYEYCLKHSFFPKEWKTGIIVTIPKPNSDHSMASNYRPITLLPVLGKNLEKIIKNRLEKSIGHKIPGYQFGFRDHRSTVHPLVILTNNIETARINGDKTAAIFLDISKAFDSVWLKGLIFKLNKLNCPKYLICIIINLLTQRRLKVKVQHKTSNEFTPQQGIPQGSPLSPFLYNVYCSDLYHEDPQYFSKDKYILQYADDTSLMAHGKNIRATIEKLQELSDLLIVWFKKWRLRPNPRKSQFIIFFHTPSPTSPTINIHNHTLYPETSVKYLGIKMDNKINFNHHTKSVKKNTISRARHFSSLSKKETGINLRTKIQIYKMICRPVIEYGNVLFLNLKNTAMKNLKVAETSAIRNITKIRHPNNQLHKPPNALLYQMTQVQPIEERLAKLASNFREIPLNKELITPYCIRRNQQIRTHYRHPEQTLWEKIQ